jgi:hypothetical protein
MNYAGLWIIMIDSLLPHCDVLPMNKIIRDKGIRNEVRPGRDFYQIINAFLWSEIDIRGI